ncbi:hypothetical protein V5O48_005751 [Marasmius crinis-equi]|uniref:MFS general substrate transporter n=1 Tax=Marasmius crinis-equi TaxID=585013 RepID=A0ABR3FLF5_9AGAR
MSSSPFDEKRTSVNEKHDSISKSTSKDSIDLSAGDEALKLVGTKRTAEFSEEYNLKLRRKLDLLVPPICASVYFTQFLDKTTLNYASIMGLPITGQNYNLVSMAFYLGFLFWEFPTTYLSQKTRVAKYLGVNIIVWGIILALHAVAESFGAFFALRFLLGMCESCVAPILILIISMFYKKNEQARRISWFYIMNGLTQIFGGFIAYGISFYDGRAIASWKIVYIVFGALAVVVGIVVLVWLPDSPVHAHFLTHEERIAALERVRDDQGGVANRQLKKDQVIEALADVRTWLVVVTTLLTSIPNGGISNFSNIIIKSFGYTMNDEATYLIGTFGSALSTVYAYNASNTGGHTKKSTINALTLISFSIGNIVGTEIFLPKDAPQYIPGKVAIMVLLTVQLGVCFLLRWVNLYLNKKKRAQIEELKAANGWSDADVQRERDKHAFADLTDKQNIYFVYTA